MTKTVIGAKETVTLDVQGNLVTNAVYSFMLDDFGPFTFEVPKAEDSAALLKAYMLQKEKILLETTKSE